MKLLLSTFIIIVFSSCLSNNEVNIGQKQTTQQGQSQSCSSNYTNLDVSAAFSEGSYSSISNNPAASNICSGTTVFGTSGSANCGATVLEINDWSQRGAGVEGQYLEYSPTGSVYRYSAILSEWVRAKYYTSSAVLDIKLNGDVMPSNEAIPWTEFAPSYFSTDGSKITFNNTAANPDNTSYISYDHGTTSANIAMMGYYSANNFQGSSGFPSCSNYISNGSKLWVMNYELGTGRAGFINSSLSILGNNIIYQNMSSETWTEIYIDSSNNAWVYFNHANEPNIYITSSSVAASSDTKYLVGAATGSAFSTCTVRELTFGHW